MPEQNDIERLLAELRAWADRRQRGGQAEIARRLGVSKQSVSFWLNGKFIPSWEAGRKIEAFLAEEKPVRKPKAKT